MRFIFFLCICLWGGLSLFAQKVHKEPVRIACIGNSITVGAGLKNQLKDSYPSVLGQMLGKDYVVRNFGVSGRTLLSKGDYPYIKEKTYQDALTFQPNIVEIKLGTNDSKPQNWVHKEEFMKDLEVLVHSFQRLASHPIIYLCYPSTVYKTEGINENVISKEIMPMISSVAKKMKLRIIDLHTPTRNMNENFPDKVHPNVNGAVVLATEVYKVLTGRNITHEIQSFPGFKSEWNGFDRYDYEYNGRQTIVVEPHIPLPGKPWIWRPAFFGAFASVDKMLLDRGFHVVYYDLTHDYGTPEAVNLGTKFYESMLHYYKLSPKVTLEGLSRGGFMVLNWAIHNVDKVACIYVDAPVCNLFSWPGEARKDMWRDVLNKWNLTEQEMVYFKGNPIDNLLPLAKAQLPIILVCGDSDKTVPYMENGKILYDRYTSMGGPIELILKENCDHHPHSLEDPTAIVDYILKNQP